ncbi:MAG: MarR family transcriptional regulator [Myxococcales bacterium]|jgi:DNA-binding MarR family transcriptional regulator|nr:MarR family transcriptional regulator [Myxococcales bacterium]
MKKQRSTPRSPAPDDGLVDALVTSAFVTMSIINRIGAAHDLSLSLIRVLGILSDRRPRMAELAHYLGLEKQTMSGLIARAEKRGLVERAPNADDGRATDVFLTSTGAKVVKQLQVQGRRALAPLLERLSASERRQLGELLRRMLDADDAEGAKGRASS